MSRSNIALPPQPAASIQPVRAAADLALVDVRVDGGEDSFTYPKGDLLLPAHARHIETAQAVQDAASFTPAFTAAPGRDTQMQSTEEVKATVRAPETSTAPMTHGPRQLEVSVQDPLLGHIDVRAEMRSGSVHAWLHTTSLADAANGLVPELHSFLRSHDVTLQSLQVTGTEPSQTRSNGGTLAESGNGAGQSGSGNDGAGPGQQRGGTRSFAGQGASFVSDESNVPEAVFVPAVQRSGGSVSIHI